jgi:hypothetical protein
MIMNKAQPTLRKPPARDQGSCDLDPAKLSTTLRELALRAHQLVRAIDESGPGADGAEEELTEVHAQIIRLQRNLGSHQLDDLATYVSALRERVEECLA